MSEKVERRNKGFANLTDSEAMEQITNRVKYNRGEITERRNEVADQTTTTAEAATKPEPVWTKEGYQAIAELLVEYDGGKKADFTKAFIARGLKTLDGSSYSEEQIHSKYPSVRKRLKEIGLLDSDSGFAKASSSGGMSDAELTALITKFKKKKKL